MPYVINAKEKAIDRIRAQTDENRSQFIINTFSNYFRDGIEKNPAAFRARFSKMAATPFNFYRGSAILFYQDLQTDQDKWIAAYPPAGQIFIHGDLHAGNFGTYLNNHGKLNFDVNDFDEGYCGPFTWDVKRLLASLNILMHSKGFSDAEIQQILWTCISAYVKQIDIFCKQKNDQFSLTLQNTTGKVKELLNETRIKSNYLHLNSCTTVENYERKITRSKTVKDVDDDLRQKILEAYKSYLTTIPAYKKGYAINYRVKDIISRPSPGIGSSGKISYELLLEGPTETLENDVIIYMKPASRSAVCSVIHNPELDKYFKHDGIRTVLCSYAMQAATPPWLGYTVINNMPYTVKPLLVNTSIK